MFGTELTNLQKLLSYLGKGIEHPWHFIWISVYSTEIKLQEQLYERNLKRRLERIEASDGH